jgi:hypothetical protein
MFAERVEHSCERELATVPGAQPPTHNLSGSEIQYNCQVVLLTLKPEMCEVLHPAARMYHSGVALSCLRTLFVTKHSKVFQGVRCCSYLCWRRAAAPLLAWASNGNIRKCTNTPGFLLVPTQVDRQSLNAVKRMFGMGGTECRNVQLILGTLFGWRPVVVSTTQT